MLVAHVRGHGERQEWDKTLWHPAWGRAPSTALSPGLWEFCGRSLLCPASEGPGRRPARADIKAVVGLPQGPGKEGFPKGAGLTPQPGKGAGRVRPQVGAGAGGGEGCSRLRAQEGLDLPAAALRALGLLSTGDVCAALSAAWIPEVLGVCLSRSSIRLNSLLTNAARGPCIDLTTPVGVMAGREDPWAHGAQVRAQPPSRPHTDLLSSALGPARSHFKLK